MRTRSASLVVVLALILASCGVSREDATIGGPASTAADETTTTVADGAADDTTPDPGDTTTTAPAPTTSTAPPTTGAADEVAATVVFTDGTSTELLHGELNDIVGPTTANDEFVTLVYQGAVPAGFDAIVLSQAVVGQVMDNELARLEATPSEENQDEARALLFQQLEGLFAASPDPVADAERLFGEVPYLPFIAGLQARQLALSSALAAAAPEGIGDPCVRHILLETEQEGLDVVAELEAGADFATLAAERSTGPSGPAGGDLGCASADSYVLEFATAVTEAELGAFVGPVETEFGWHVILVERYEVNGDQLANDLLTEGLTNATVTVDERLGTWDGTSLTVIPVDG